MKNFVQECGATYFPQNINKIVGGITARSNSWPSIAYIRFKYRNNFYLREHNRYISYSFDSMCGGVLIDKTTVLSAAHCVTKTVSFSYGLNTYTFPVTTNSEYPTLSSMYTIYLGLQDSSVLDLPNIYPAIRMTVRKVTAVCIFFFYIIKICFIFN